MGKVHAIVGEEIFLIREAIARVKQSLGDDCQRIDFDGETAGLADVLDEARSYSMFAGAKMIVIWSADAFISDNRREMEAYVQKPDEGATLVLRCKSLPGNQTISKLIAKHGTVEKCESLPAASLPKWIINRAQSTHKLSMAPDAAGLLAENIGSNLSRLDNELAKLALAVDGRVTADDVRQNAEYQRELEMWHLTDELTNGRIDKALQRWRRLVAADTSSEFRAATWLTIWIEKVVGAHRLQKDGISPATIGKQLKIWPAANVGAVLKTGDRLGADALTRAVDELTESDLRSKSGLGQASVNVERFILSLA